MKIVTLYLTEKAKLLLNTDSFKGIRITLKVSDSKVTLIEIEYIFFYFFLGERENKMKENIDLQGEGETFIKLIINFQGEEW